jgi:hypothetical protein
MHGYGPCQFLGRCSLPGLGRACRAVRLRVSLARVKSVRPPWRKFSFPFQFITLLRTMQSVVPAGKKVTFAFWRVITPSSGLSPRFLGLAALRKARLMSLPFFARSRPSQISRLRCPNGEIKSDRSNLERRDEGVGLHRQIAIQIT